MPFTKVKDYYINLDHIYYVQVLEREYKVYFGGADGETKCESLQKESPLGKAFIQVILTHEL